MKPVLDVRLEHGRVGLVSRRGDRAITVWLTPASAHALGTMLYLRADVTEKPMRFEADAEEVLHAAD